MSAMTKLWHLFYCRWYVADRAGRLRRAKAYGRAADALVRWA